MWSREIDLSRLLVAKPVLTTAIGALPGNLITGHSPSILCHAGLANHEATAAGPAELEDMPAAGALVDLRFPAKTTPVIAGRLLGIKRHFGLRVIRQLFVTGGDHPTRGSLEGDSKNPF